MLLCHPLAVVSRIALRYSLIVVLVHVATGAAALRAEATAMSAAMEAIMWDTDHFVTQVNPEPGPAGPRGISTDGMDCAKAHNCRDFVDYDSNVRRTTVICLM